MREQEEVKIPKEGLYFFIFIFFKIHLINMNGHINETAPPLVPIGEVKLVQVEIVVWFVRTCEVSILFVLFFVFLLF